MRWQLGLPAVLVLVLAVVGGFAPQNPGRPAAVFALEEAAIADIEAAFDGSFVDGVRRIADYRFRADWEAYFLGRPYDEGRLIGYAYDYEQATRMRRPPPLAPPLDGERIEY